VFPALFPGLENLNTAVFLFDQSFRVKYINAAAENLFGLSRNQAIGQSLGQLFIEAAMLDLAVTHALAHFASFTEHEVMLETPGRPSICATCVVTPVEMDAVRLIMEFFPLDQQLKIAREERMLLQQQENRELIRNLAHEIKNPLGGIRGAAQLLERELPRPDLLEYTQVIIKEADRLQSLMDRLLTPHRIPHFAPTNIHEVLERVRSLSMAETPETVIIQRDYDLSLPALMADQEQLIQAILNIVRNAVQAMEGHGEIVLRTRVARQVTLAKKRYPLAIQAVIIDNGPGVPESIRERIFYPLVSGKEGGSGLGLTLAQTYINRHQGAIACDSRPGATRFTILLPINPCETE